MYYVSEFDSTSIVRLDRETLKEDRFATFSQDVVYMSSQGNNFYVVTDNALLSMIFSSATYYLLNSSGGTIATYGGNPDVQNYHFYEFDSYISAKLPASVGYLRNTARELCWMSKDKSSVVATERISGWNPQEVGIFTTLYDGVSETSEKNKIVLYRAADGLRINVTNVHSDQAFFTLCQSNDGSWYFFDQTDSELILYVMSEEFTNKAVIKTFPINEIPYNLTDCGMTITNNRIYFYSMPNDRTSKVIYRYDVT